MTASNMRILRKVRTEFDYAAYVETSCSVKYSGNGELRINCPRCGDHKYKLYINDDKKYFNCFKCDFNSGNFDVFDFVAEIEGITRSVAMLQLCREYADTAPDWQTIVDRCGPVDVEEDIPNAPIKIKSITMPLSAKPLTDRNDPDQSRFWDYLLERGFKEREVLATKAHYVAKERLPIYDSNGKRRGNIGQRVLFPVYGGNNELVSWLGRSTNGAEPKYFNAPESEASRTLWPFVPLMGHQAVVVEGLIDALAVRRQGFAAYATLGKKISTDQIELLKLWHVTSVVLFWDKKDAKKDMLRAIETLKLHFKTIYVPDLSSWPADKDSGDTLNWEEGSALLKDMLTNHLIDVDSLEFAKWNLS